MDHDRIALSRQYDWLAGRFYATSPRPFDSWAARPARDGRRGVTVIGRISPSMISPIVELLANLRHRLSDHLVYSATSAHLTIIVPVPAGRTFMGDAKAYIPIVRSVADRAESFEVHVAGVSVAGSAVILRGFPIGNDLATMRESLRSAFAIAGLANFEAADDCYDGRRQPRWTAHITVARLSFPDDALEQKLAGLDSFSCRLQISRMETVQHDEYLTPTKSVVLDSIDLRRSDDSAQDIRTT